MVVVEQEDERWTADIIWKKLERRQIEPEKEFVEAEEYDKLKEQIEQQAILFEKCDRERMELARKVK